MRLAKGLSGKALALRSYVCRSYLSRIENDSVLPTTHVAGRIEDALGLPVGFLDELISGSKRDVNEPYHVALRELETAEGKLELLLDWRKR